MLNLVGNNALAEGVIWCLMRTIEWISDDNSVRLIDQRLLPNRLEYVHIHSADEMILAIQTMAIRGAPAIGVAGVFALAIHALQISQSHTAPIKESLRAKAQQIVNARPTAVNLRWGIERMLTLILDPQLAESALADVLKTEALAIAEEDVATNLRMAQFGASLIQDGDTILHHCNTGSLAAVDWGTALGAIRFAHEQGKHIHLLVDETRPRLQGARLTAWECMQYGISFEVISDNAAGYYLHQGAVQKVMFGSDRVTANGDVVNKIGSYMLSLAAYANHVPVYPVFPLTTYDATTASGADVEIEERPAQELTAIQFEGEAVYPKGAKVRNPAFDVTPAELISAWVTDQGVVYPPFAQNMAQSIYNIKSSR